MSRAWPLRIALVYNYVLPTMAQDDAIVRFARQIDAVQRDEQLVVNADAVAALRRRAACELHHICRGSSPR
jgi:hypothetical protein